MKRGAARQISKDDDDDEIEEITSGEPGAFLKAEDAVLATRKIKPIPRRMAGSPSPFSSSDPANGAENPATPPKFTGFGVGTSVSSGFSFTPPTSSPNFPSIKPTPNIFGSAPGTPTPSTVFAPPSAVAVASTASSAAKTFASFLGDSAAKPAADSAKPAADSAPKPAASLPGASGSVTDDGTSDTAALKYYTSLRGLNVSILAFITKAIDQDPFADLGSALREYSCKRMDVQKEFDNRPTVDAARSTTPAPSPAPPAAPSSAATAAPLKMPAPPSAFAGFGTSSSAAASPPKFNGAVDKPPAPPTSPFTFGSSSSASSSNLPASKPSLFTPSTTSPFASTTPSAFGSVPSTSFFGSGSGASTTVSPFATGASPSPFGGPKPAPSPFGGSTLSTSPFPFGGGGSIGNPVGFSFGSPKGESPAAAGKETKSEGSAETHGDGDGAEAGSSQETEKASIGEPVTFFGNDTPSGWDAEGEGEEDEETVKAARVKAFRMRKKEEKEDEKATSAWIEIGVGFIRLKKHKETPARRLLLRNSYSGKIQMNFALYPGLKASQTKKSLTLVGHDEAGESQTYSIRFQSEDVAKEFQAALDLEVAQIKSK